MTPAQLTTLKADILADPTLSGKPMNSDGAYDIAAAYNLPASPAFTVWRAQLTPEQSRTAIVQGAIQLDNLTVGKRDALLYLTQGTLDARDAGTRQAFADLCGTQTILRDALVAAAKRPATRIEKLFATGTGSVASPGVTTFEGTLAYQDVEQARAS